MATLYTHAAVGLALGNVGLARRMPTLFWVLAGLLPIVPDLDAFSDAPYGSALGHRGFTHSLGFAILIGSIAAAATFRRFKVNVWALACLFSVVTATHGLLDALTDGGEGIAFFWPASDHRFGPWGPIHVADIADELPNPWRSRAIRTELLWVWLPMSLAVAGATFIRRLRSRSQRENFVAERDGSV
jgi:inner membrane protein